MDVLVPALFIAAIGFALWWLYKTDPGHTEDCDTALCVGHRCRRK